MTAKLALYITTGGRFEYKSHRQKRLRVDKEVENPSSGIGAATCHNLVMLIK